jgi:hypothetical protein
VAVADIRIKFFVADYRTPQNSGYQHELIALAEGLRRLEIPFVGSNNYWVDENTGEYLIAADDLEKALEINIFHERFLIHFPNWEQYLDLKKMNILIDSTDGFYSTPCHNRKVYERFDLILKTHFNENMHYPKNVVPWAFGLTNRMISSLDRLRVDKSEIEILNNFAPSLSNHSVRAYLHGKLHVGQNIQIETINSSFSQEEMSSSGYLSYWAQTGKRHNEEYYVTLNRARFTLAYGGFFAIRALNILHGTLGSRTHAINHRFFSFWENLGFSPNKKLFFIHQFDSYRLWEVFYSYSIPIMLNFKKEGFILPQLPIEGKHYIPVSVKKTGDLFALIASLSADERKVISAAGRNWAYENYCPSAVAIRLLKMINFYS